MKEYGINIALKGGNYIQYFVKEEQLEHHTKGILNVIQLTLAGDHRQSWVVTEKDGMQGPIIVIALGDQISGFGVFLKPSEPKAGENEEMFKLQMESLRLGIELQMRHIKTLDEGEKWRDP